MESQGRQSELGAENPDGSEAALYCRLPACSSSTENVTCRNRLAACCTEDPLHRPVEAAVMLQKRLDQGIGDSSKKQEPTR
jgi:hypothetical protein